LGTAIYLGDEPAPVSLRDLRDFAARPNAPMGLPKSFELFHGVERGSRLQEMTSLGEPTEFFAQQISLAPFVGRRAWLRPADPNQDP
jgi:hypothetical protein